MIVSAQNCEQTPNTYNNEAINGESYRTWLFIKIALLSVLCAFAY